MLGTFSLLLCHTHLRGKGAVRYPLRARERCRLFQHSIDLLEGQALGFWNQEDGVKEAEAAETTPEKEDV